MVHPLALAALALAFQAKPDEPLVEPLAPLVDTTRSPLESVVERWATDRQAVARRFPVASSPARRERLRAFALGWRKRLEELGFAALNTEGKVDYLLLDNALKNDLARLGREEREAHRLDRLRRRGASLR